MTLTELEAGSLYPPGRGFFIDSLLVRVQFIIEMIWWTGLAPGEFEFPFTGSLMLRGCGTLTERTIEEQVESGP